MTRLPIERQGARSHEYQSNCTNINAGTRVKINKKHNCQNKKARKRRSAIVIPVVTRTRKRLHDYLPGHNTNYILLVQLQKTSINYTACYKARHYKYRFATIVPIAGITMTKWTPSK